MSLSDTPSVFLLKTLSFRTLVLKCQLKGFKTLFKEKALKISNFNKIRTLVLNTLKVKKAEPQIQGKTIDNETRCVHYHSDLDIIAIKFKCCGDYYPCFSCHEEAVDHVAQTWQKDEFDTFAIICGICKHELTIHQYLQSDSTCPNCQAAFNPKCSNHYHLYFDTE
jgi:uncharacterized CHY-type Zn-finger protein